MNETMMRTVLLDSEVTGLLIPISTGVIYEVQTGGFACLQDRVEGIYVPLSHQVVDHYPELNRYFVERWKGRCSDGIDSETAVFIDATLQRLAGHSGIRVDPLKLGESREAWVHVTLSSPTRELLLSGWPQIVPAILTWPNSD